VPDQQRTLQHQRDQLGQAAGVALAGVQDRLAEPRDRLVEPVVRAGCQVYLGEQRLDRLRLAHHRAQRVEGRHVAGALPDRAERRLAVQPGHAGLLHVPVAAEALQRLRRVARRALAHPVLGRGEREPPERSLGGGPGSGPVRRARQPERHRRGGLGLDRQVREHRCHGRLRSQRAPERGPVRGVERRRHDPGPHPGRGTQHAVQPGHVHHVDDRADPAAFGPHGKRHGPVVLHLGAGVRAIA
jgi:hypothetical protein